MKGDIAFVGFMLTADEWQALDAESRAQLIAVATRRADPFAPRRLAEGTGRHEVLADGTGRHALLAHGSGEHEIGDAIEMIDADLLELDLEIDEPDSNLEPVSTRTVDDGWEDFSDWAEL